jgi:hypothetical protein
MAAECESRRQAVLADPVIVDEALFKSKVLKN